jgi:hypothetical protein
VKLDGELKVAQYGQWDGYPTGQGATIQEFLQKVDLEDFKKKVAKLGVWTDKEVDEIVQGNEQYFIGANTNWATEYPELSRDTGAGILQLISDGTATKVVLNPDFKEDSLFCEYWYELDLNKETVTMNGREFTFDEWRKIDLEKLENEGREE